jgi:hypothetical protein
LRPQKCSLIATKKYIEALIRDGDNFNYREWLREVREEEAQAKRVGAASNSNERTTPKPSDVVTAAEIPSPLKNPPIPLGNNGQTSQDPTPEIRSPNSKARKKKGFVQRLLQVSAVWEDFQETRARDACSVRIMELGRTFQQLTHVFRLASTKRCHQISE